MMNGLEKSESAIVAMKPANKAGQPAAEWVEPRAGIEGNTGQPHTRRTQGRNSVSQGLDRVRHAARQRKKEKFTLTHWSGKGVLSSVQRHGLRSLRHLAEDQEASPDVRVRYKAHRNSPRFGKDPDLIYFRPVGTRYAISEGAVVIAVKPDAVDVFDQEHRARGDRSASSYGASKIPIAQYLALESRQPKGTFLSRDKTFVPWARHTSAMEYMPEVCVEADRIGPELFVKHEA